MKTYNPLTLNTATDEPTFVNEEGTKWWLVSYGSHLDDTRDAKDGAIYRVRTIEGVERYLVVVGENIVLDTSNLEQALFKVDEYYLRRTK